MQEYRRRRPLRHPEGKWLFVTWCLHGSLPGGRYPPPGEFSPSAAFAWIDRYLDCVRTGPMYLAQEPIARLVVEALECGERMGYYNLGAFAVLSNHVHALLLPKVSPTRLLHSLQGATGRQANRILGRPGETFWETESYHYWVRDARQWKRIVRYIEEHPVKAGLVSVAEDYRWSSAAKRAGEVRAGAA